MPVGSKIKIKSKTFSSKTNTDDNISNNETSQTIPGVKYLTMLKEKNASKKLQLNKSTNDLQMEVDETVSLKKDKEPKTKHAVRSSPQKAEKEGNSEKKMDVDEVHEQTNKPISKASKDKNKKNVDEIPIIRTKKGRKVHEEQIDDSVSPKKGHPQSSMTEEFSVKMTNIAKKVSVRNSIVPEQNFKFVKEMTPPKLLNEEAAVNTPSKTRGKRSIVPISKMEVVKEVSPMKSSEVPTVKVSNTPTKSRVKKNIAPPTRMEVLKEVSPVKSVEAVKVKKNIALVEVMDVVKEDSMAKSAAEVPNTPTKSRSKKNISPVEKMEVVEEEVLPSKSLEEAAIKFKRTLTKTRANTSTKIIEDSEPVISPKHPSPQKKREEVAKTNQRNASPIKEPNVADNNSKKTGRKTRLLTTEVQNEIVKNIEEPEPGKSRALKRSTAIREVTSDADPVNASVLKAKQARTVTKEQNEVTESLTTTKIPGLALLDNLKSRKSLVKSITVPVESHPSKIPGIDSIADIRRRKSMLIQDNNQTHSIQETTATTTKSAEIVPGLSSTAEIRRRKSTMLDVPAVTSTISEPIISVPISEPKKLSLSQSRKVAPESPKVPGFSLIEEIRSRKSAVGPASPYKHMNIVSKSVSVKDTVPKIIPSTSVAGTKSVVTTATPVVVPELSYQLPSKLQTITPLPVSTPTATSIMGPQGDYQLPYKVQARKPLTMTSVPCSPSILRTSVLCPRPSPSVSRPVSQHKRPMSCLSDNEEDDGNTRKEKVARTTESIEPSAPPSSRTTQPPPRRQSVSFCQQVEVKEIRGNSFNNDDSTGDNEKEKDNMVNLQRQVEADIARTQQRLAQKRSHGLGGLSTNTPRRYVVDRARDASRRPQPGSAVSVPAFQLPQAGQQPQFDFTAASSSSTAAASSSTTANTFKNQRRYNEADISGDEQDDDKPDDNKEKCTIL